MEIRPEGFVASAIFRSAVTGWRLRLHNSPVAFFTIPADLVVLAVPAVFVFLAVLAPSLPSLPSPPRSQFFMEEKLEVVVAYGRATDDRDEAATALVRITDYSSRAVSFLSRLICTHQRDLQRLVGQRAGSADADLGVESRVQNTM